MIHVKAERGRASYKNRLSDEGPSMSADRASVTIVGAGPAGLACAIALARHGRHVVVRERHSTVGQRFHGDFQGLENWSDGRDALQELEAFGIAPSFAHHPVYEGIGFDAWGKSYGIRGKRPLFYLIRRGPGADTLDAALLRQAREAGVEVRFNDHVRELNGPTILAAGPHTADAIAVGYVFDTEMADGCWAAFDDRLAPSGYAYLLVHRGQGTVASCMFTGFKDHERYRERTVSFFRERVGLSMKSARRFGGSANFRLPRTGMQGRSLVVGEHAGFQDALAGFGMRYAIRSGLLAAESEIDGTDYTRLWRREMLPFLRHGIVNRLLFNAFGETGRAFALRILSATDAGLALRRLYRPSVLDQLLFPLAWLRYHTALHDRSCDHAECRCVLCRCGSRPTAAAATPLGGGEPLFAR